MFQIDESPIKNRELKKRLLSLALTSLLSITLFTFCSKNQKAAPNPERLLAKKNEIAAPRVYHDPNPYTQQLLLEYNDFIERAIGNGLAPGAAVVIIKDTSVIFLKGFG